MKLRTIEEYNDAIDSDFAWRKKELYDYKQLVKRYEGTEFSRSLVRGGVPILYAHWEGFVKNSSQIFLEYVGRKRIKYLDLAPSILYLTLKGKLKNISESDKSKAAFDMIEFLETDIFNQCDMKNLEPIKTANNLRWDIFEAILVGLGIDRTRYSLKQHFINKDLCDNRNIIAHGKHLYITNQDFYYFHEQVLILLTTFRNDLDNLVSLEKYRRTIHSSASTVSS